MDRPIPTPPPWWMDTHVAPDAVLSMAFSSGQSAIASEPSFMPSVSRYGLATEPQSRWSRPSTIGALISPRATRSLNASSVVALAVAEPADPGRQALEMHLLPAILIQRVSGSLSGNRSRMALSVRAMSFGSPDSAAHRNGPLPSQKSGRI